ncbi:MAG: hypothetical protein RSE91_00400 [Bacilli bacterium]
MINKKGFTTIELILSFTLVMLILISVFNVIMNYKSKQQIEAIRNDMLVFKNTVTKSISDDLIKDKAVTTTVSCGGNNCLTINFSDNSSKNISVVTEVNPNGEFTKLAIIYGDEIFNVKHLDSSSITNNGSFFRIVDVLNDTRKLLVINIPIANTNLEKDYGIHIVANIGS